MLRFGLRIWVVGPGAKFKVWTGYGFGTPNPKNGSPRAQLTVPLRVWGLGFRVLLLGFHRDNGKENGNYYIIIGCILVLWSPLSR